MEREALAPLGTSTNTENSIEKSGPAFEEPARQHPCAPLLLVVVVEAH